MQHLEAPSSNFVNAFHELFPVFTFVKNIENNEYLVELFDHLSQSTSKSFGGGLTIPIDAREE
jgi:hypothetical protein